MRAPYDIVNYSEYVDAAVAVYSYFGYNNGVWLGPSIRSLAEVLTGKLPPWKTAGKSLAQLRCEDKYWNSGLSARIRAELVIAMKG